jgi:putative sterol carrier protein
MTYEFLSAEWIEAARQIHSEAGDVVTPPVAVTMNLIVTDVPFGDSPLEAHLDTTDGSLAIDEGHRASPDMVITVDWMTAKALFIEGDTSAAMSAFMAGKIRVEGDMAKLLAMQQGANADERSQSVVIRLREITA